jgi:type I restriction enzyme R subunit
MMMAEFDRLAWENYKELAPNQKIGPGKAIVFAITKHHAARLASYLNALHPEQKGRYAEVITSDVSDAENLIKRFKREDYPQVAVSVGMLDTGFNCPEVLHLVMCRRVRSPILYQQMRGRGTRTAPHIGKRKFVIYDFFGNHEYFNDSDTDVFTGTGGGHVPAGPRKPPRHPGSLIELGLEDEWLHAVAYVEVGPEGERVDKRDYVTNWQTAVQSAVVEDPIIQKIRRGEALSEQEENTLIKRLNQPEMYFNEENLRRAYRQPGGNLIDFIKAALGSLKIKSREEQLTESFQAWLVAKSLAPQQAQYLSLLKNRGIARGQIELADLFQPPLSILNAAALGVKLFGEQGLKEIIQDMNESVFKKTA